MKANLTLIPTPIDDISPLEPVAKSLLEQAIDNQDVILIEDHKVCRRRWLAWGLPREAIENFVVFDEHNEKEQINDLLGELHLGKNIFLLSDCGLPAFCDPGQKLVDACHVAGYRVNCTPFPNSVALAVALSGLNCNRFYFAGFPPKKNPERKKTIEDCLKMSCPVVLMDTPYRMTRLFEDLISCGISNKQVFLAMDLGNAEQELIRDESKRILKMIQGQKREFVVIIDNASR